MCYTGIRTQADTTERSTQWARNGGSNENIHVGDIFHCWNSDYTCYDYYQVTALRGKTQVVLRAIKMETYINEGIAEDSPLYWRRKGWRPLPGQFWPLDKPVIRYGFWVRGKYIDVTPEEVTAWVMPEQFFTEGRPRLQAVGLAWKKLGRIWFELGLPEDWEPWDAEMIRKLEEHERQEEEYERQEAEARMRRLRGEKDVP